MARKSSKKKTEQFAVIIVLVLIVLLLAIFGYGYFVLHLTPAQLIDKLKGKSDNPGGGGDGGSSVGSDLFTEQTVQLINDGDFSVHFLELGNNHTGDCIYIKAGDNDIVIDAGSRQSSIPTIKSYLDGYVLDNSLEFVIATHADQDHISGFAGNKTYPSLFTYYECETIIDFARTGKNTEVYNNYVAARDAEVEAGAVHYTALECWKQQNGAQKTYQLAEKTTMSVLYQKFYEEDTSDENDYSVCLLFTHDDKNYLFTGDLEKEGEESLVENNDLPQVELFKAGHHGSKTSSTDKLLSVIRPKIVCVCCCAGNDEYTENEKNQFPTQDFINRVAPYTDAVYVTSLGDVNFMEEANKENEYQSFNGTIVVLCNSGDDVKVFCSYSTLKLKETQWFKEKRETPSAWL